VEKPPPIKEAERVAIMTKTPYFRLEMEKSLTLFNPLEEYRPMARTETI